MSEFPNCEIKLCDLEVSRVIQEHEQIREIIGTPDYVGNLACIQICYFDYQTIIFSSWDSGVWANQSCSGHLVTGSVGLCPAHGILAVWRWDHYFYEEMIKLFFLQGRQTKRHFATSHQRRLTFQQSYLRVSRTRQRSLSKIVWVEIPSKFYSLNWHRSWFVFGHNGDCW